MIFKRNISLLIIGLFLFGQASYAQLKNKKDQDLEAIADSIYFNNDSYAKKESFEKAVSIYKQIEAGVEDVTSERFKRIQAKKYVAIGLLNTVEMQYDSAIANINASLNIQNTLQRKDTYLKGHSYRQLYENWKSKGNYDSVINIAKKAEIAFRDTLGKYHKYVSNAIFERGLALGNKGYHRERIQLVKEAIANNIAYQGENNITAAVQEHILATIYDHMGYYRKELECYKKVIRRWEAIPETKDMSYLAIAYGSTAIWYLQHGDVETAEKYLLKRERLVKDRKKDLNYWFNETFIGRTKLIGWHARARFEAYKEDTISALNYTNKILNFIDQFDKNKKENNPHNLSYFYAFVRNQRMASLRFKADMIRSKRPEEAKRLHEEVLKTVRDGDVSVVALKDKIHLLDYYIKSSNLEKANTMAEDLIAKAIKESDSYGLIHFYSRKTDVLLKQKKYKEFDKIVAHLLKNMLQDSTRNVKIEDVKYLDINPYGSQSVLDILIKVSKNYVAKYTETNAVGDVEKAFSIISLASEIFSENFNHLMYNEKKYKIVTAIHEQLLNTAVLYPSVGSDKLLQMIEENTSKTLWKRFLDSRQSKFFNIPDSILQQENDLKAEYFLYKKALYSERDLSEEKNNLYKEKLLSIENEIETIDKWYEKSYPSYYNQKVKSFSLDVLKKRLNHHQTIIKYVFGNDKVYAFIVTKEKTELSFIADKEQLTREVNKLLVLLKSPDKEGYMSQAKKVYTILVSGLPLSTNKKELVFIQEDILHYVPMEALVNSQGKYLVEGYQVSYAPSLLLWNEQVQVDKSTKTKLGIYAPSYRKGKKQNPKRNDTIALLGASLEAAKIANFFQSDTFIGIEANKEKFAKNAGNYKMLHLAMHSSFNNVAPEFSSLVFSANQKDNKLFISELYNLNLNADLAVLSACNTGAGEFKKGEGMVNVSRAFTYAGVPSLVASLWAVPDLETSEIMVQFYEALKEGKPKDQALQEAKLMYLNKAEYEALKHPYYWAGFVVSGNVSPVDTSNNNYMWYGLGFIVVVALFFFRKRLF